MSKENGKEYRDARQSSRRSIVSASKLLLFGRCVQQLSLCLGNYLKCRHWFVHHLRWRHFIVSSGRFNAPKHSCASVRKLIFCHSKFFSEFFLLFRVTISGQNCKKIKAMDVGSEVDSQGRDSKVDTESSPIPATITDQYFDELQAKCLTVIYIK